MKDKLSQILIILIFIFIPYYSYKTSQIKSIKYINGTIQNINATFSEGGNKLFYIIKLDNNITIHIYNQNATKANKGKRVLIKEVTTNFFNTKKFYFIKFLK